MMIALKEANETVYWLELLHASEYIPSQSFEPMRADCAELVKLLASIVKSLKKVG
jgi:four helix bundle protein